MAEGINWYPGHMAKATRLIQEKLRQVDLVVEIVDARIPLSSRNPVLQGMVHKPIHLLLLNKSDLADPSKTREWEMFYRKTVTRVLALSAMVPGDIKKMISTLKELLAPVQAKALERQRGYTQPRVMFIGIPNCGKSSWINALAGKRAAITADRPGVTRGAQWIKTANGFDLLDMPGVLWPKLGERHQQLVLAGTGAIKDTILDVEQLAFELFTLLIDHYPSSIEQTYQIELADVDPYDLYLAAAKKRGCVRSGGKIDEHRFAVRFLDELRGGKLGRLTLDFCSDTDKVEVSR